MALFLSLIIGLISGIDIAVVIGRAVIFTLLFGLLGFGSVWAVKKFVPEISEGVSVAKSVPSAEPAQESMAVEEESHTVPVEEGAFSEEPAPLSEEGTELAPESGFKPMTEGDFPKYDSNLDLSKADEKVKMGRHILEEKGIKYEPKIMADAIRTMMNKDNE